MADNMIILKSIKYSHQIITHYVIRLCILIKNQSAFNLKMTINK